MTGGHRVQFAHVHGLHGGCTSLDGLEGLLADQLAAQPGGELVDGDDGAKQQKHDRQRLGLVALADRQAQEFADAAAADGADDRGGRIDLQAQQK